MRTKFVHLRKSRHYLDHSLVQLRELPLGSAHRAQLVDVLRVQPFHYAVNVKAMRTLAPDQRTVVSGHFAFGAASVKRTSTNATVVIVVAVDPLPECDAFPAFVVIESETEGRERERERKD